MMIGCFFCFQFPFTVMNMVLALTQPHSECMDKAHVSMALVVRPWFLSMGITEISLIFLLLISLVVLKLGCIYY